MKKYSLFFMALISFAFLISCDKVEKDPVLDMGLTVKPSFSSPAAGTPIVLASATADEMITFQWSQTQYNLTDIENTKYVVQMDLVGNNFESWREVGSSTGAISKVEISQAGLNQKLLNMGVPGNSAADIEFRVFSFINDRSDYSYVYSDKLVITLTTYEEIIYVKPIYLLGDGTTAGWNNASALEMTSLGGGQFGIVETLAGGGKYIKFISMLGAWAPQWGTDASGTFEGGPLVYRPTEAVPDPAAIPTPADAGDYRIVADTALLTYSVEPTSANLYLLGDATDAGWDNTAALPLTKLSPGKFSITANLSGAGKFLKFIAVLGQWAPQYGTDATGTGEAGVLVYSPNESVPDPPGIPAPNNAGSYLIEVNLHNYTDRKSVV